MENLARREFDSAVDKKVKKELMIANLHPIKLSSIISGEVKTHYIGFLNGFIFERAWTYWVVNGHMPLEIAEYIYENYKNLNIRAGGHCGNVSPGSLCMDPIYDSELRKLRNQCDSLESYVEKAKCIKENPNNPKFVNSYHVDTQLGLNKLIEVIKSKNIHTELFDD